MTTYATEPQQTWLPKPRPGVATSIRVVLSTIGKFHSFDLARQLEKRGALQAIFTGYPAFKLRNDRLPAELVRTYPWLHAPYMRFAPRNERLRREWEWQDKLWFDRHVARKLPDCDLFCGLSGSALQTGKVAKARGAKYVCDRGSSHIRFQDKILREEYDRQGIPFSGIDPRVIEREEAEYAIADAITLPSSFALNSFLNQGVDEAKLRVIPYGVELDTFNPAGRPNPDSFNVLFVGSVNVRKGVSYLLKAFAKLEHSNKHLTLAGTIGSDLRALPHQLAHFADIEFAGHVPQPRLKGLFSKSHVLVLPSIEEGFGLVQAQAMACGCPVISSANTGASDLFTNGVEGFITPIRDPDAIAAKLQLLADDPTLRESMSLAAMKRTRVLGGWDTYGEGVNKVYSNLL